MSKEERHENRLRTLRSSKTTLSPSTRRQSSAMDQFLEQMAILEQKRWEREYALHEREATRQEKESNARKEERARDEEQRALNRQNRDQ